jgi:hypothetical protein
MRAIEFILADEAQHQDDQAARRILELASSEIIGLRNRLAAALRRGHWYDRLIEAGVEEWEGFEAVRQQLAEEEYQDD